MNENPHETIYQKLLRAFKFSEVEPIKEDKEPDIIYDVKTGYQKHDGNKDCKAAK